MEIIEPLAAARAVDALGALAQPHRLATFRLLIAAGQAGMAAGDIAAALSIPANSLSFHLTQLKIAGLIHDERHGRSICYHADFAAARWLIDYLMDNCCGGVDCIAADTPAAHTTGELVA